MWTKVHNGTDGNEMTDEPRINEALKNKAEVEDTWQVLEQMSRDSFEESESGRAV